MTDVPVGRLPAVSVVIPTLNAASFLPVLFNTVFSQEPTVPVEVVLVDSMSTDATRSIAASDSRVRVVPISNFSHGRARNLGASEARGEIVVLLTQDALPADGKWLAGLLHPFSDPQVVASYLRNHPLLLPHYLLYNLAKIGGSLAAHVADWLLRRVVRAMSLHRYHWEE